MTAAAILVAFVIGELIIRIFHPYNTVSFFNSSYTFNCFQSGDYYWIKFKPDKNCILKSNAGAFPDVEIKTNSLGLRGDKVALPKPEGTKRLLFVGDSFTVGWGVKQDEAYPWLTTSLVKGAAIGQNVDLVNAAITAAGPTYYYLFNKYHPELEADIVIIGFYVYNDITDLGRSEWKEIDQQGLPIKTDNKKNYVDSAGVIRTNTVPLIYRLPLLRDSQIFGLFSDKILYPAGFGTQKAEFNILCLFQKQCHEWDKLQQTNQQLLLGIKKITSERKQKLVVLLIPGELQVYQGTRFKYDIPIALTPDQKALPNQRMADFLKEQGIDYLDLLPILRDHPDERAYFEDDDHWNALGHRFASEALSKKLEEMLKN